MDQKIKRLSEAEQEVMAVLWNSPCQITSNSILEKLKGIRDWKLSTLMTVLSRLAEKGYVTCDRSTRMNLYSALISENEYKLNESKSLLEKMYGNSIQMFVSNLYRYNALKESDIAELREFLNRLEDEAD